MTPNSGYGPVSSDTRIIQNKGTDVYCGHHLFRVIDARPKIDQLIKWCADNFSGEWCHRRSGKIVSMTARPVNEDDEVFEFQFQDDADIALFMLHYL